MTHDLLLAEDASVVNRPEGVSLLFGSTDPASVALSIALLNERVVEAVSLVGQHRRPLARILKSSVDREISLAWAGKVLEARLGETELERWLVFFMRYYKLGMADVDHLDVDGEWLSGESTAFTIVVPPASPPASASEARRRLSGDGE